MPWLVTNSYYLHIINLAGIYTLIALGLNILSGYTGQVSMGQAGFFAVGAYTAGLLALRLHFPFWPAVAGALLLATLCGIVIGVPAVKLKGPYLVMATVGFGEIIRLVLVNWVPVTRGAAGLTGIPLPAFLGMKVVSEKGFFYLIFAMVFLGTGIALRVSRSKIGRTLIAIREDDLAAEAMGIPVNHYKVAAFAISAAYAGLAGAVYGSFAGVASPDNFTFDDSVAFLCMSVVGGNRSVAGAVVGAFALTILSEVLRPFQTYRLIIYGMILICTVVFMPQGLIGLLDTGVRRFRSRRARPATVGGTGSD
ncbi:MAG TPA: branched-chain amino acid ABC transporter permease [Firmicutes bacterium]|nr:branched-chain amino acid ABC transporter permease [Bacillota bacterium]